MEKIAYLFLPVLVFIVLTTSIIRPVLAQGLASNATTNRSMCYQEFESIPQPQRAKDVASCIAKSTPVWNRLRAKQAATAVFSGYWIFGEIQKDIIAAGPKVAGKMNNISGQIFGILTLIAFFWLMMPMWFKGLDWSAIVMFWVKVLMLYGMLKWYNYFFNDGIIGFFVYLSAHVAGNNGNLLTTITTSYIEVLNDMQNLIGGGWWPKLLGLLNGKDFLVGIDEIITLISLIVAIGTVYLIEIYIVIALVTGYLFIPFAVIKQGEFLFNGWLKFIVSAGFSYFLISLVLQIFSAVMLSLPTDYQNFAGSMVNTVVWAGVLAMFSYIIMKIPGLAAEIISGTPNISVGGAAAAAVGAVSIMSGVGRVAGGAGKAAPGPADKFLNTHSKTYNKVKDFAKKMNRFGKSE